MIESFRSQLLTWIGDLQSIASLSPHINITGSVDGIPKLTAQLDGIEKKLIPIVEEVHFLSSALFWSYSRLYFYVFNGHLIFNIHFLIIVDQ